MEIFGGIFVVGLVLWWIIKSDLEERDLQKRRHEENEKRDARALAEAQTCQREEADARERNRILLWREENEEREREAKVRAERLEFEADERRTKVHLARCEKHLKLCQDQCRSAQDADGLLPIEAVGRILGRGPTRNYDGTTDHGWDGLIVCSKYDTDDFAYAVVSDEHPFPKEIRSGFFRASEVITWLDEADREGQRTTLNWLDQRRSRLPTLNSDEVERGNGQRGNSN